MFVIGSWFKHSLGGEATKFIALLTTLLLRLVLIVYTLESVRIVGKEITSAQSAHSYVILRM